MTEELNLSSVFKEITKVLETNRQQLDNADEYNHNHGSNMVQTFTLIQKAVESKKTEPVSDQLAYASEVLKEKSTGGTAQIYSEGLAKASQEFVGKDFNASTAGTLINSMMGIDTNTERGAGDLLSSLLGSLSTTEAKQETQTQTPAQSTDLFGSLIGTLTGQQQTTTTPTSTNNQSDTSDLLGGLLGGLTGTSSTSSQSSSGSGLSDLVGSLLGNQSNQSQSSGLDSKDLLSLGLAYFAAKQSGQSNLQAIMQALSTASPLGKRQDQQQSGALVINTILNMLGSK